LFLEKITLYYRYRILKEIQTVFFLSLPSVLTFALLLHVEPTLSLTPLSSGHFLFLILVMNQWAHAIAGLYGVGSDIIPVFSLFKRLTPILSTPVLTSVGSSKIADIQGVIEVKGLTFSYQGSSPVLCDVSFDIRPGMFVAIVGPSGCGKSTLLNLLLGFDSPTSGSVFYDGLPLQELDIRHVRRSFGVVLQDSGYLSGDILSVITGGLSLSIDDAWVAAKAAGISQDIESMPMGMHTVITNGGKSLSGGQRQRLLLARALINHPRILFLDEATSALDNRTQAQFSAHLSELNLTRVVIAHRLSTIQNADLILVMDKGRIVERGTFQDLIQQNGLFAQLSLRQTA
jgi:ATP-binding cassette subfamily C protein